jgi:hypothetical protein
MSRGKRRLLIDVLVPDGNRTRMTIRGDSDTVASDVLDRWVSVCGEVMALVARGINADVPATPETPAVGSPPSGAPTK